MCISKWCRIDLQTVKSVLSTELIYLSNVVSFSLLPCFHGLSKNNCIVCIYLLVQLNVLWSPRYGFYSCIEIFALELATGAIKKNGIELCDR